MQRQRDPVKGASVSAKVRATLEEKPFLLEALAQRYANVSEVARQLRRETGGTPEAVRAAIMRHAETQGMQQRVEEKQVLKLFRNSKLLLSSKMVMMVIERTAVTEAKAAQFLVKAQAWAKGPSGMSLAVEEQHWDELMRLFTASEIITAHRGLVAVTLVSPPDVVSSLGFVATLTSRLAREGINLMEFWSADKDAVMLFSKEDGVRAYQLLSNLT